PGAPLHLPSFPTRRSSDLQAVAFEAVLVGDLLGVAAALLAGPAPGVLVGLPVVGLPLAVGDAAGDLVGQVDAGLLAEAELVGGLDRKSTRLNSSHVKISYA